MLESSMRIGKGSLLFDCFTTNRLRTLFDGFYYDDIFVVIVTDKRNVLMKSIRRTTWQA